MFLNTHLIHQTYHPRVSLVFVHEASGVLQKLRQCMLRSYIMNDTNGSVVKTENFIYVNMFELLPTRWEKSVEADGEYFQHKLSVMNNNNLNNLFRLVR